MYNVALRHEPGNDLKMALQNLRDKLLKVGLVDKKQKQQADTQDRREKKQKGIDQQAQEEAEKQRLHAEKLAAEAEAQRQLEVERKSERERHEQHHRVRNICERWAVRPSKPGQRRFHFVKRNGFIGRLLVSDALYDQLMLGALVVVEHSPDDAAPALLPPEPAERVKELDELAVRFWARSAMPIGYIADSDGPHFENTTPAD